SDGNETVGDASSEILINSIMNCLTQTRCLVVLDNLESILRDDSLDARFADKYVDYQSLLMRVARTIHSSCVLVTARVVPDSFERASVLDASTNVFSLH